MNSSIVMSSKTDYKAFLKVMQIIDKQAAPAYAAETLNQTADSVTRQQERNIRKRMIVRSKYTINSTMMAGAKPYRALNKARGRDINRMFSRSGSVSPYLWMQDLQGNKDFIEKGLFGGAVPIPLLKVRISKSKKKSIAKKYRLGPLDRLSSGEFKNDQFIGRPRGGGAKGLYQRIGDKDVMLRNLESKQIRIKDTNFHEDAVKRRATASLIYARFKRSSIRELKRKGVI
ncbi:MAG: hypothetical protein PQJ46_09440 [Spirochaetales bacterium]|nr:hypothetical protein [Spirochaetales bacterium]